MSKKRRKEINIEKQMEWKKSRVKWKKDSLPGYLNLPSQKDLLPGYLILPFSVYL